MANNFENSKYFVVVKKTEHDTQPSYLKKLPNTFTDDVNEARKFMSSPSAKNAMLKITTYSLNPQNYSIVQL